ncbi:Harbinger transposase-derived nuclease domain - like 7 [Theobroma cacao]|nr:Harbinger transposase-derived nuclease domain - like 7 [Theobroma cacao]
MRDLITVAHRGDAKVDAKPCGVSIGIWGEECLLRPRGGCHGPDGEFRVVTSYALDFASNREYVSIGGLKSTKNMLVDEQVAIFLHIIAHHVLKLQEHLFRKPEPIPTNSTDNRWKWFKNYLGALDGTYIRVKVPSADKPRYRTRSVVDGRVLRDALRRRNGLKVPNGCYYLVDAGYTNCEGFLAPFRGQRYHLNEWRQGHEPSGPEEFFNMKHAAARNVIERCFGLLKMRWGILRSPSFYPIRIHNRIIIACCLLHNFIRREMSFDPSKVDLGEYVETNIAVDEDFISTIDPTDVWGNFRMELANQMFNEWQASRQNDD